MERVESLTCRDVLASLLSIDASRFLVLALPTRVDLGGLAGRWPFVGIHIVRRLGLPSLHSVGRAIGGKSELCGSVLCRAYYAKLCVSGKRAGKHGAT